MLPILSHQFFICTGHTLKVILPYDRMQIALSCPKILKDILTRAAVKLPGDQNIDTIIQQCLSVNSNKL
jgi:hypothetical protein